MSIIIPQVSKLGLRKHDMGIDIICSHETQYYAVQVKFRSIKAILEYHGNNYQHFMH